MEQTIEKPTGPKLRRLLFQHRSTFRDLESEGISRWQLREAVRTLRADGEFPAGECHSMLAMLVVAELAGTVTDPQGLDWDKIFELIEKLMPLIEMWLSMCAI